MRERVRRKIQALARSASTQDQLLPPTIEALLGAANSILIDLQNQRRRQVQLRRHRRRHVPPGRERIGAAQHAAMRDRHRIAFALRDIADEIRHPRQQIARALTALGREVRGCPGALETIRAVAQKDLLARQPFPFAPMMLGKPRIRHRIGKAQQLRRLAGAVQWTGERAGGFESRRRQQRRHLDAPRRAQRHVDAPLDTALFVPVGRPMAQESDAQFVFLKSSCRMRLL